MKNKESIKVIVILDVEEEGLFCGKYQQSECTVQNVLLLPKLKYICTELGFPLTLLCAYTVFKDKQCCNTLAYMRDNLNAEIGAHLHHWSTPPFDDSYNTKNEPKRTHEMNQELLLKRLQSLLKIGKEFHGANLTSFRMGRWDLKSYLRNMLADEGILVDSSITPNRQYKSGADHFLAPYDPYWHKLENGGKILEAPLTQIAYSPLMAKLWYKIGKQLPLHLQNSFIDKFKYFGVLSVNPVWHTSFIMNMATRFHITNGGKVINMFWHSSEMMPGASPNILDQDSSDNLIQRIYNYLKWLKENYEVQGITLSELYHNPIAASFPIIEDNSSDW